jgi:hypothetical protein
MDRQVVQDAIEIMQNRLKKAIDWSTRYSNCTGEECLYGLDEVESFFNSACALHEQWADEYSRAVSHLREEGYKIPGDLCGPGFATPMVCFSQIPIVQYADGTRSGAVWIIGCGCNPEKQRIPSNATDLIAGDVVREDGSRESLLSFASRDYYAQIGDETNIDNSCDVLAGLLLDNSIRYWETIRDSLVKTQQRLSELWSNSLPWLTPIEERNKFCFEQRQSGETYKEINSKLKHHPEWEAFDDARSVRSAITAHGRRIGIEPRKGRPGRPRKSARPAD